LAEPSYLNEEFDFNDPLIVSVIDDLPLWSAPFGMRLLDTVIMREHVRVLDVGSGTGFPMIELAQRLGRTCKVLGIDPWREAIDRIEFKISKWNIGNIGMIEGVAEDMPFDDGYFDLIISNNGFNNVEDQERAFAESARVSKPGAQIVFTQNLPGTMLEFYRVFEKVLAERGMDRRIEKMKEHIFEKRKPLSYIENLLKSAGLNIVNVHEDSFDLRYTDGSAMLNHFVTKLAFLPEWRLVVQGENEASIFESIEEELNAVSRTNGEFVMSVPWVCIDCRRD